MCGILLIASAADRLGGKGPEAASPDAADFAEGLACRGPDAQGSHQVFCGPTLLRFHGSLLQLRGAAPSASPLVDASGNVLLFNGQIFPPCALDIPPGASDAQLLLAALGAPGAHVPAVLSGLRGPWALAYWHAASRTLWFGRDLTGRRSLLVHAPSAADGRLILSSSAPLDPTVPFQGFEELPPGIYSLALEPEGSDVGATAASAGVGAEEGAGGGAARGPPTAGGQPWASYQRHEWAEPAVRKLAAFWRAPELVEPPQSACSAAAAAAVETPAPTLAAAPAAAPRDPAAAAAAEAGGDAAFERTVDAVLAALRQAVVTRCRCIDEGWHQAALALQQRLAAGSASGAATGGAPPLPGCAGGCVQPSASPLPAPPLLPPAPVLVLFSGGVDSTLLTALAHEALPPEVPIDLASVCFDAGASPDRVSALDALEELRQLAPGRQWRLVQVDCTLADVDAARPRLLRLLAPSDTVMDLNIGAALWLAAQPWAPARCRSAARVVLLGHGADELFGGYGRHRTAFRARGWQGLGDELALDLRRLWLRNLGRDDRLVADHGREARHPFLDEGVVAAALAAPLHHLADLRLPPGEGDKRLLRACLRRLGLPRAAARAKRAIQFGSRLAAKTNSVAFGGTRRANLRNAGSVRLADVPGVPAVPAAAAGAAAASGSAGGEASAEAGVQGEPTEP
ncbi:hypothetical protein ABPG75_004068 [Micractinium tetrahymenae]